MNHKFKSRPVEKEAFRITEEALLSNEHWPMWLHEAWNRERRDLYSVFPLEAGSDVLVIKTIEGYMEVELGSWIIRGLKGELYACVHDVFTATYEPVDGAD